MKRLLSAIVLICLAVLLVFAQQDDKKEKRDLEKEKVFWQQLAAIDRSVVETFKQATEALDQGDKVKAIELYQEVLKQAPDFDQASIRMAEALFQTGQKKLGLESLEKVIKRNPTPENLFTMAIILTAYNPEKGNKEEKERALQLSMAASLIDEGRNADYLSFAGELALDLERTNEFREISLKLENKHPDLMFTHYFNTLRAITDKDWQSAEKELQIASTKGLSAWKSKAVKDRIREERLPRYFLIYVGYLTVIFLPWLMGIWVLYLLGKYMSTTMLRLIENADPNALASDSEITLRKRYKLLIKICGLYYYISLPFVALLVMASGGLILCISKFISHIENNLIIVIAIAILLILYKMIRSLFIEYEREDPGRSLREDEAPGLWRLTKDVASVVGTYPIDEIRITPGTELAVYEQGSKRERSLDSNRRVLVLGIGILNGFKKDAFCAVLAHEYSHFAHGDTAGGDIALRVNQSISKFAVALYKSRQADWWNLAFQFLRVYHFLFRRISYGATRLQEVLADRVAAHNYGPVAFEAGLRHIIYRKVEFDVVTDLEITAAIDNNRELQNIYDLQLAEDISIDKAVSELLNRTTSEDDTHPSPNDRFRLVQRVQYQGTKIEDSEVWDLFSDREKLTNEMSAMVGQMVNNRLQSEVVV